MTPDRFASVPHGGQKQNNPNPTTFLSKTEDRKCEKLWTLPRHQARVVKIDKVQEKSYE
ncbi:MAG: hypothetical protein ACLGRW_19535 [Acidobacteriota bacterium]|jgi:hypothetical protein